jgi:membrane-associated protease RseP (regulator of RpoE activity)
MGSKLKKWYVILGMVLGGLAVCFLLLLAGGLAGGAVGFLAAQRGHAVGLPELWQEIRPQIRQPEEAPRVVPQVPMPWQMPPGTLEPTSGQLRGALIVEVDSGGPAEQGGMETGDIVIAVDDKAMDEDTDLASLVGSYEPGDRVSIAVVRHDGDTELVELQVTLGSGTNEQGEEVAHLGVRFRSLSSMAGVFSLDRMPRSRSGEQTY